METRVAVMGIIVEDTNTVNLLNEILHEYSEYIIEEWEYLTNKNI